ncbi:MAG TPA: hypothetical protein P5315_11640 [Clostridia bacterium]|nr:hypothetical protein [Clostridia bacterium]
MKDLKNAGNYENPRLLLKRWKETGRDEYREKAYGIIGSMIEETAEKVSLGRPGRNNARVSIKMAARVNFGGVFTDIPPYCYENGGAVLNAPVLFRGDYPIRAEVSVIDEILEFECVDTGESCAFDSRIISEPGGICRSFRLHQAVCRVLGIKSGIKIVTESGLPMGSGLGTSSILAAAIIKCILRLYNLQKDDFWVVQKVFEVEQLIGSRGGWQDPCGGLFRGMKICSSHPGLPPRISIDSVRISDYTLEELNKRLIVFYSGTARSAGNVLLQISDSYLLGEKRVMEAYERCISLPGKMKIALESGDLLKFGSLLFEQHEVNKALCPEYITNEIESMFNDIKSICSGAMITGAGGGGYVVVLLDKGRSRMDLCNVLGTEPASMNIEMNIVAEPYEIQEFDL